jgi:glyoxylase-like metal-dependent hydrolase (beta-lactamase superfamily II)
MTDQSVQLNWAVFSSVALPTIGDEAPPGQEYRVWPPISSTLIWGEHDAVLVDAPITIKQAEALADWVVARKRNLTTLYITHGHGDHWLGAGVILERFPGAQMVADAAVIDHMREQSNLEALQGWRSRFPGQIVEDLTVARVLTEPTIDLEGRELAAIAVGHTDMDDTTVLHVPSIGLVVAGDAVYNDVFLNLRESNTESRNQWLAALDLIEALHPVAVVAGHKREGRGDSPQNIAETRQYIRDFERVLQEADTPREVFDRMVSLYPTRAYPSALWGSARVLKG